MSAPKAFECWQLYFVFHTPIIWTSRYNVNIILTYLLSSFYLIFSLAESFACEVVTLAEASQYDISRFKEQPVF